MTNNIFQNKQMDTNKQVDKIKIKQRKSWQTRSYEDVINERHWSSLRNEL